MTKKIVVLISGQGRNLQALIEAVQAGRIEGRIAAVISNKPQAGGLERARAAGIATATLDHTAYDSRESFDAALADEIDRREPDAVILAGFMRILGDAFIHRYKGRLLNIHPSLLPLYPGLKTHERALQAGDAEHGATVHFVTEQLDGGPCIVQGRLTVKPQDDAKSLAERVMNEVEMKIYPQAVAWLARGDLKLDGAGVRFRGRLLHTPLGLHDLEPEFR